MNNNKRKYITGIDGLRSIAVIGVILYHLAPGIMPGGFLGVTLFFVISGFLMTDILLHEWQNRKKINLKNFYVKRIKRIYPSLLVMFGLTGSFFLFLSKDLLDNFRAVVFSSLLNVNNFWQILNGSSYFDRFSNESPFTHLWSLSIEGQFYLLWPILVAFLLYKKNTYTKLSRFILFTTALSAILMIAFYQPNSLNRIYYGTDTRIFSILIGAYLAIFIKDNQKKIELTPFIVKIALLIVSLGTVLISFVFLKDSFSFVYQGGMFIFSLSCALLLGSVLTFETANDWLTNPVFKWIGTRSYEIYLWQFPVMITYEKMVKWDGSNNFFHLIVQLLIILGLSELTYRCVQFLRFKVTFTKDWLLDALKFWQTKLIITLVGLLCLTFTTSLFVASSGRSADSIALEKKLKENQKKIAEKKPVESKTKESTSKSSEKVTADSSEKMIAENLVTLTENEKKYLKEVKFSAIGDSVLLSAAPEIQALFPNNYIEADVGLQLMDSAPIFKKANEDKKLGDVTLVVLGTNGSFTTKEMADVMQYLKNQQVFFVNTMVQRSWQKSVNDELEKTVKNYDNAHLIDWKDYSTDKPDWFEPDDVHLKIEGADNFSALIGKTIYDELNK